MIIFWIYVVNKQNILLKLILLVSFYFLNEVTRKCKITYVTHIQVLLHNAT